MFRIECFVEDKHLADALRVLAKLRALNVTQQPVENATAKRGKVVVDHEKSMPQHARLYNWITNNYKPGAEVFLSVLKEHAPGDLGIPLVNIPGIMQRLKADKLLKFKRKGVYVLMK